MNEQFLDNVALASFIIGIVNYKENLTQNDKQEIMDNSAKVQDEIINRIDRHLEIQDQKIDAILEYLEMMQPRHNETDD